MSVIKETAGILLKVTENIDQSMYGGEHRLDQSATVGTLYTSNITCSISLYE